MGKYLRSIWRLLVLLMVMLSLFISVGLLSLMGRGSLSGQNLVARVMQRHLRVMTWVCGLRLHVRGSRPRVGETFLLLSNHVSYWDILALGSLFPMGFIAKDCIASWPVIGSVIRMCNTIFVDRGHVMARFRTLRSLQSRIPDLPYCVFPEGTTTAGVAPRRQQWHRGNVAVLREPGVEIWLAGLHYARHEEQAWIDDAALMPHLWKVMQAPVIDMMIHLQPFRPESGLSLREVSEAAWSQTVDLCYAARRDLRVMAVESVMSLSEGTDSSVG
ncbi:lysophospholipid acyltransferase family protein [Oligoflexus tunisiensis]|uniref:lysophospholipid acyltransferase family protein n=1 Tax=Oligoflexus tunisiensis TaxID=708132 RepID=UPI00114CD2DE|nr:lysophospholipid acyltransferase family protein [Oligoflexus tunisiensis]